jgi:broad specificity phosphatase PhoE
LEIVLVRHAQSRVNQLGIAWRSGQDIYTEEDLATADCDFALTSTGHAQAAALGKWLRSGYGLGEHTAITSDYLRAKQTYWDLRLHTPIYPLAGLNEFGWGLLMEHPSRNQFDRLAFEQAFPTSIETRAPGGESVREMLKRTAEAVTALPGGTVVIVAHEFSLLGVQMALENLPHTDDSWVQLYSLHANLPNCGVIIYSDSGKTLRKAQCCAPYPERNGLEWMPVSVREQVLERSG